MGPRRFKYRFKISVLRPNSMFFLENGYEKISLSVFSTNKRAINLYKKFGFEIEGVKKKEIKIDEEYVDEILMALFL